MNKKGLLFSIVGLVLAIVGMFLPWFDNTQLTVNGLGAFSAAKPILVVLVYGLAILATALAGIDAKENKKKADVIVFIRFLSFLVGIYSLMGVKKVLVGGPDNLPVKALIGTYVVVVGFAAILIGTFVDYKASLGKKKWTTVDLVLIVMVAAIYAAALLTLSFIKLAPGTWLRPANAMQAPFGILFGIPGCLGIAVGNLISDLTQGTAPHVLVMGFLTNFLTAFIPYICVSKANVSTRKSLVEFVVFGSFLGALIVAGSIFINVMFGLTPKAVALSFFPTTFLNQLLPSMLLGVPLCKLLYPFVIRSGLYRGREVARVEKTEKEE